MDQGVKANVLLVDDKTENLLALESVLTDLGQNLISATSAREALRYLLLDDFALILLDVEMPGLNGFELAELIRGRERTQHTPIIFISAESFDQQYIFKGYSLGAVDYLSKPIEPEILKSKVGFFSRLFLQNQEIKHQAQQLEQAIARLDSLNGELERRVALRTAELERANAELEREVAVRRISEARLATEHTVTRTLAASPDLQSAIPPILRAFCENMDADVSAFWIVNKETETLRCLHVETLTEADDLSLFIEETRSREFPKGVGVPGHVWEASIPLSLPNSITGSKYPRATYAAAAGLHTGTGFPITISGEVYGVIEFASRSPVKIDTELLNALNAMGSEIGQFVERKRAEADRENLLAREKSLREQAEVASRLKDEFLATVSHELRTPLNSILGWGQILQTNALSESERNSALDTIYRNAKSQAQLIDDLLDTSRLITGNLLLNLSPTDVVAVAQAAIGVVRPAAAAKRIVIDLDAPDEIAMITCDTDRLQQMIWNLLTNAIKFTDADGRVLVRIRPEGGFMHVSVTDNGHGIAPEFLPHVFERFRQEDSSSTRRHEGLGLGLAIVSHLAERHGGRVTADSEGLGKGSTFSLFLPFIRTETAAEAGTAEPSEQTTTENGSGLANVRVLIVDDDGDACEMLAFGLGLRGADVETCGSAAEALDKIGERPPDVLLTDINMPDEDGYSLVRKLRSRSAAEGANIPAIALTAMARPEDSERTLSAGFQRHVSKPVEIDELSEAIIQLVGQ
jgi:signal transduction histidine kinase/DNA-binding response OmpR family regulator